MFWMQPRPTWWLVIMRPSGETKEPEPPSLKRTEASRTLSSHSLAGVKPYCSCRSFSGGLSKVHMPSSAAARAGRTRAASRAARQRERALMNGPPGEAVRRRSASGLERHVGPLGGAPIDLPRAGDLLVLVLQHLVPLGQPAGGARDREQHREHVHREPHGLVDQPGVEVDVGVELALDEVLVLEGDALQLEGDVEQRVAAGDLEHLLGHLLYD